jgi:hypothetical protein
MAALSDLDREELRLLYDISTRDLSYFKTQQWSVAYYSLLIDAGLIGVARLLEASRGVGQRAGLALLTALATAAALIVLFKLQNSIEVRQSRLDAARETFGDAFTHAWSAHYKHPERVHSVYLLYGGVALTAVLTIWLVGVRL